MPAREPVTAERLRVFLEGLGRQFHHPARLYLSGGESLVWRGLRAATHDIDVSYEVDPRWHGEWIQALRTLIERLGTSVEEASPGDFIPLPRGAEARASFVGRYGPVDVFLLDPYSIALSKLERAHAQDLEDVRALLAAGVLDPTELRRLFDEILPDYGRRTVHADPERFRRMLDLALAPR